MNKKEKKIYIIGIIIIFAYAVTAFYFSPIPRIAEISGKIDPELKHLLETFTVSGLGLILFTARHLKITKEQEEQIEVWDLAIMIIIPSVDAFSYITKIPQHWPLSVLVYISGVIIWYVLVRRRHKIFGDPKEEKKFKRTITYVMSVFVFYGAYASWAFFSLMPYMTTHGSS